MSFPETIWLYILTPFETLILLFWFQHILNPRFGLTKMLSIYYPILIIISISIAFFAPILIRQIFIYISMIAITRLFYKNSIAFILFNYGLSLLVMLWCDSCPTLIVMLITKTSFFDMSRSIYWRTIMTLFYYGFSFSSLYFLSKFLKNKTYQLRNSDYFGFAFIMFSQQCIYLGLCLCIYQINSRFVCILTIVCLLFSIASILLLFQSIEKITYNIQLRLQNDHFKRRQHLQLAYFTQLNNYILETQKLRHDFSNHVQTLKILIDQQCHEEALAYYNELKKEIQSSNSDPNKQD